MAQPVLTKLEAALGHTFKHKPLLIQALTHSSLAYEQSNDDSDAAASPITADNEQLEFLGDAVIGLLIAESLYRRFPASQEGQLTRLRAALVSRKHLGHVAARLHLGNYLFLGKGEERSGGRRKAALLANCIEAVAAAMYLDASLEVTRSFVEKWIAEPYAAKLYRELESGSSIGDHKSALQEFLQARKAGHPEYNVKSETGPDHQRHFLVEVHIRGEIGHSKALARGRGTTKKKAEQEAARRALEKLQQDPVRGRQVVAEETLP